MTIELDGVTIGAGAKPYIIAEVGVNARTDLELAKQFIATAAESGADAVKFQTHLTDEEMAKVAMEDVGAMNVYGTVDNCVWSRTEHEQLQACAQEHEITFLSTPFSAAAVDLLADIDVPGFKIGSGEMDNFEILERVCETKKPALVSTGMHSWDEIKQTIDFLQERATSFALFYCVSEYPTDATDFDFETIAALRDQAGVPIGFSDHSTGVEAAKAAIGYGADLVEKHFTLDRRLPGPDQVVSIEPDELNDLCSFAKLYHDTGSKKDMLTDEEEAVKVWAHHSIVAAEDIEVGDTFNRENITTKRPGTGIPARKYFDVLGTTATESVPTGAVLPQSATQAVEETN